MRKEDFYTGELLQDSSPPNLQNEAEAAQMASFGKYDYDPGMRMMTQPIQLTPGAYGYNTNPYGYTNFNNYMNQPMYGLGMNPYMYQQQQQYYNPNMGNPALNAYNNQQQQQSQFPQQYFVKPVNFSGDYLPPADYEEQIQKWKLELWNKQQEQEVKDMVDRKNSCYYSPYGSGYGYNYYGVPYYMQYNNANNDVARLVHEMEEEAKQNRVNLNIQLSKLAHNICGHNCDDKEIEKRYTGEYVDVPQEMIAVQQEMYNCNRFANMVPFDNANYYREKDAEVSREFNSVVSKDSNMKECFEDMGVLHAKYVLQEEYHRRKDGGLLYNSDDNSYKYFVRAKAAERYAQKTGSPIINNAAMPGQQLLQSFPTLQQAARLCDDGTLNITCNFGSKAGQVYSVHNSQEAGYEQDRERFLGFINSIPGSIYLNNKPEGGENK